MRGIGLTDAMDRLMRGFTGGADAASQGIQGAVGMLAQQKQMQDKMAFETSQAQAKMEADQAAAKEKRAFDEQMARRREDFDAADKGLRRRIVTEPSQQEFEHASSDVSARIKDNPVTNLFDSGLTGLVPAGVMTALEGGSVMNDPNNQARLMQQREAGWERDPSWVNPRAKPSVPPPTGAPADLINKYRIRAEGMIAPIINEAQLQQLLEAAAAARASGNNDLGASLDRQVDAARLENQAWKETQADRLVPKLIERDIAGGVQEAELLRRWMQGQGAGPQPWSPGEGDVTEPEPFAPPMAAGDEPGDVGDIDVDDESIPIETRIQALGGGRPAAAPPPSAPPAPQSQWLPGGDAQIPEWTQHQPPPGQMGPSGQTFAATTQAPPSRIFARPPLRPDESAIAASQALDENIGTAIMQGADRATVSTDPIVNVNPWQFPQGDERESLFAEQGPPGLVNPFDGADQMPEGYTPGKPFQDPTFEPGLVDLVGGNSGNQQSAAEQTGIGDLTKFLSQFADQGGQGLADLLTGGAQAQARAGTPTGTPVQPTVGLEGGGMSAELPLVNVAPGIDLAEPAAASYHDLMNDPNMTPEMQQVLLRPGQGDYSAFRTYETQQNMRDRWDAGERPSGWVHRPGVPGPEAWRHTAGTALDLGTSLPPNMADLLMRHGWRQLAGDPTHWWFAGGQ